MNLRNVSIRATGTWQPRKGGHVDIRLSANVSLEELAQWLKIDKTEQPEVSIFLGPDDPETVPCEHCNESVDVGECHYDDNAAPFCDKCWNDPDVWAGDPEALKEIASRTRSSEAEQPSHKGQDAGSIPAESTNAAVAQAQSGRPVRDRPGVQVSPAAPPGAQDDLTDHLPDGDWCGYWKRNGVEAYCALHLGHRPKKGEPTHAWMGPDVPSRPTEGEA